ncbi:hypothetical protein N9917_00880 [Deltaproteobacteria bacterium]|nr:hypothetical protein [Deltaproteobacteria bacterium]
MDTSAKWGLGKHRAPQLRFDLGTIRWSTAALAFLKTVSGDQTPKQYGTQFVMRHAQGDWGDAPWADHNESTIQKGDGVIIGSFPIQDTTLLVLTAFASKATIVAMPSDTKDTEKLHNGFFDIHIETEDD